MDSQKTVRTKWVDVAKVIAIIAVLIDHTYGTLYTNSYVAYFSYYSVSLFIVVMGVTTIWSYSKNSDAMLKKVKNKCLGIIRPYVVATVVIALFRYRLFDFEVILNHLIWFNISGPFYYVLLYIQLVLISPILFYIFQKSSDKKYGYVIEVITFGGCLLTASLTTNHSNILGIYGGGGKLFGGTYLILFYIGMWFGKYCNKISINAKVSALLTVISCGCVIVWWRFIAVDRCQIDLKVPYGDGINPPSVSYSLCAIFIVATFFFLEKLLQNSPNDIPMKLMGVIAFMGKHTLYIFLYHRFFQCDILPYVFAITGITIENVWVKRIVYFVFMIGGSMLLEFIFEKIHEKLLIAYKVK